MLKKILLGIGVVFILFVLWSLYGLFIAKPASPKATATYSDLGVDITVNYSQPYKKDRLIFGKEDDGALQPFGKYWRLGANAATEISLSTDVYFGGKALDAGTYRMYAVPGSDAFQITVNSELDIFFGVAEPDPELDILTVEAPVWKQETVTEQFVIQFRSDSSSIMMDFIWDDFLFNVPIQPRN
ncbi:MAG: hypothetical protein ACJA08_001766 [Cyclobacteriaceae bacterium]|jgi:hypothetical protein